MSTRKNQKKQQNSIYGIAIVALLVIGGILATVGMSRSIGEIREIKISKTADAILTSAGLEDEKKIPLNVTYYDQRADACVDMYDLSQDQALKARQFEWTACGYRNSQLEQGLVSLELDGDYLPVGQAGKYLTNRSLSDMSRWFNNTDSKSQHYAGTIDLVYDSSATAFFYRNDNFYPLDDAEFSNGDFVNTDGHNHLFTMTFAIPVQILASGDEQIALKADDDTFVYIGDKLALDMGGIHSPLTGKLKITSDGKVMAAVDDDNFEYSGIVVNANEPTVIRVYHADRDSAESEFGIRISGMTPEIVNAELANADTTQVAYNEGDQSYAKPLGSSSATMPDGTRGYIILATTEGIAILLIAVIVAAVAHTTIKNRK